MEDFRRRFLPETVKTLRCLREKLQTDETISDADRRDAFRRLHTIKGTSQTLGFSSLSRISHELENLLSANGAGDSKPLLLEGLDLAIQSAAQNDFRFSEDFIKKVRAFFPDNNAFQTAPDIFPSEIPKEIANQLSNSEKKTLADSFESGKQIFLFESGFDLASFAVEFKKFRESLIESGEIIATFPGENSGAKDKIVFRTLFAASEKGSAFKETAEQAGAEIVFQTQIAIFANALQDILKQIVKYGEDLAGKLGRKVSFEVSSGEINPTAAQTKLIFDILLHLVRNAVDHAFKDIEKDAACKIEIDLKSVENGVSLRVKDNGCGIDAAKIKAKAIEKNLIPSDRVLTARETIDLIFLPEFSTAETITEISGRGVGLDAVKDFVANANGKIGVESEKGRGTAFEIFLPGKDINAETQRCREKKSEWTKETG